LPLLLLLLLLLLSLSFDVISPYAVLLPTRHYTAAAAAVIPYLWCHQLIWLRPRRHLGHPVEVILAPGRPRMLTPITLRLLLLLLLLHRRVLLHRRHVLHVWWEGHVRLARERHAWCPGEPRRRQHTWRHACNKQQQQQQQQA
jgi:hypothetical protein